MSGRSSIIPLVIALGSIWGCFEGPVPTPAERLQAAGPVANSILGSVLAAEREFRFIDALALSDSLIRVAPDLPDGHFHRGQLLSKLYQLEAADSSFSRAANLDAYHRGAWYQRGHIAFERGAYRRAITSYRAQRSVIERSPRNLADYHRQADTMAMAQSWLQEGRAYQLLHVSDSALTAYDAVLRFDSTHVQAHVWVSEILQADGDVTGATNHAATAYTLDSRSPETAYRLGILLFEGGRFDDARQLFEIVVAMQPWNAGAHYNLGRILVGEGRRAEGEEHLARTDLLQILDQAIDQARAAAARFPNDASRWREVAELLGRAGRTGEQREMLAIAQTIARQGSASAVIE